MDSNEHLQSEILHKNLIGELMNHRQLRSVERSLIPSYIGGAKKEAETSSLSSLQAEFLKATSIMQEKIRPAAQEMETIRGNRVKDDHYWEIRTELLRRFKSNYGASMKPTQSPRLQYQLDLFIDGKYGWRELMSEVRTKNVALRPVEFEGFYIVDAKVDTN